MVKSSHTLKACITKGFIRHHFQKRARFIHNVIIIITFLSAIVSHELKLQQCVDLFFFKQSKYAFWSENSYICSLDIALYVYLNISHSLEGRKQKHKSKPQHQNVHKIPFHYHYRNFCMDFTKVTTLLHDDSWETQSEIKIAQHTRPT